VRSEPDRGAQPRPDAAAPRRQRRRAPETPVPRPPRHHPEPERRPEEQRSRPRAADDSADGERGLRGLVGAGNSQLNTGAALRARDAARPTEADLAAAERDLTIVRRHWVPRDPA
jgi:hypothetical protein